MKHLSLITLIIYVILFFTFHGIAYSEGWEPFVVDSIKLEYPPKDTVKNDISILCGLFEGNITELQNIMNNAKWKDNRPSEIKLRFESFLFRKIQYKDGIESLQKETVEDQIKYEFIKYLSTKERIKDLNLSGSPFTIVADIKVISKISMNSELLEYNKVISELEKKLINITKDYKKNAKLNGFLEVSVYLKQNGTPREIKIIKNMLSRPNMSQMILLDLNDIKISIPIPAKKLLQRQGDRPYNIEKKESSHKLSYRFEFDNEPEKHVRMEDFTMTYISPKRDLIP